MPISIPKIRYPIIPIKMLKELFEEYKKEYKEEYIKKNYSHLILDEPRAKAEALDLADAEAAEQAQDRVNDLQIWRKIKRGFFSEKTLFLLGKSISKHKSKRLISLLTFYEINDIYRYKTRGTKEIKLYICHRTRRYQRRGLRIFDTIQAIGTEVTTISLGRVWGIGSLILAAGTSRITKTRYTTSISQDFPFFKSKKLLIRVPQDLQKFLQVYDNLIMAYVATTKQTALTIEKDINKKGKHTYMSPEEAKSHGIIDSIHKTDNKYSYDNISNLNYAKPKKITMDQGFLDFICDNEVL